MAAESVGEIGLDLVVNQNGFNRDMGGITSLAKKAAGVLATAFAVTKIVQFGAECIKLGSDLQEVQNVVDTTFTQMNGQVNEFAKNAMTQFGLSETVAKKYMGTFGAMGKAFGFSEQQAYGMAEALTGLSGDVASFYNLSSDEAYTKLKSVFTGETESLKDLGVVMTQAALDQFALSNGFGKTTKSMTEQEKVALRFAFVQKQLALSSGDFARTQDSWANQTRVLKLQFDSLKASIGQGLINVFTPVIKGINFLLGKLLVLASAFKSFTAMIMGVEQDSSSSGMGAIASEISGATTGMDGLSDSTEGVGDSAKKAAKEMKGLMGFDEINAISSSSDSGESGAGSSGMGSGGMDFGNQANKQSDLASKSLDLLYEKLKKIKDLFSDGFNIGFGDTNFDGIKESLGGIKEAILNIFGDSGVQEAANTFINSFVTDIGKELGAIASIGITIADNILGGINKYLANNTDRIKQWLIDMFNISAATKDIEANFMVAIADIFNNVFSSETAKQITADLIEVFSNSFMEVTKLGGKFGRDVTDMITGPIISNSDKIKTALMNTLKPIQSVTSSIAGFITETFTKFNTYYDKYLKPFFDSIKNGLSEIVSTLLDTYNTYVAPIMQGLGDKFTALIDEHISPFVDKFLEYSGKMISALKDLWENVLVPLIKWIIENIVPTLADTFNTVAEIFMSVLGIIFDVVGGMLEILGGLIGFIAGIFTGDWSRVWDGIKSILKGVWDIMVGIVGDSLNDIWTSVSNVLSSIYSAFSSIWNAVSNTVSAVVNGISSTITDVFNGVYSSISGILYNISSVFSDVFNGLVGIVKAPINGIIKILNTLIDSINSISVDVPDWDVMPDSIQGKHLGFNISNIPMLAKGGYVKANTPQLAMIGDNRHEGEIVAPESKIEEAVAKGIAQVMSMKQPQTQQSTGSGDIILMIDGSVIGKVALNQLRKMQRQGNITLIPT